MTDPEHNMKRNYFMFFFLLAILTLSSLSFYLGILIEQESGMMYMPKGMMVKKKRETKTVNKFFRKSEDKNSQ